MSFCSTQQQARLTQRSNHLQAAEQSLEIKSTIEPVANCTQILTNIFAEAQIVTIASQTGLEMVQRNLPKLM